MLTPELVFSGSIVAVAGVIHVIYGNSSICAVYNYSRMKGMDYPVVTLMVFVHGMTTAGTAYLVGTVVYELFSVGLYNTWWHYLFRTPVFFLTLSLLTAYPLWLFRLWLNMNPHYHVHAHTGHVGHSGFAERFSRTLTIHEHTHSHLGIHNHLHSGIPGYRIWTDLFIPAEVLIPAVIYSRMIGGFKTGLYLFIIFGIVEGLIVLVFNFRAGGDESVPWTGKFTSFIDFLLVATTSFLFAFTLL